MARYQFGGGIADWGFEVDGGDDKPVLIGGGTVQLFNQESGGTQYTDLAEDAAGATPITFVKTSDGSDGRSMGQIPPFYGPNEVTRMWASLDGGPRVLMSTTDTGAGVSALQSQLSAHIDADNPHGTSLALLIDTALTTPEPANGAVLAYDLATHKWVDVASTGLNPADFVKVVGGSTIQVANGDVATQALRVRIPAGDRALAPDTLVMEWNRGTDGAPDWQRTGYFNEYGELRSRASADNRVAFRCQRRSAGSTANILEATDQANNPFFWVTPDGKARAANIGYCPIPFVKTGNVATGVGTFTIYNDTGLTLSLRGIRISVGTSPTGADLICDLNIGGVTVFTTQANRPRVTAGSATKTSGLVTNMNVTAWPTDTALTLDVDQVGSGTTGADLVAQILAY